MASTSTIYATMAIKLLVETQQDGRAAGLDLIIGAQAVFLGSFAQKASHSSGFCLSARLDTRPD